MARRLAKCCGYTTEYTFENYKTMDTHETHTHIFQFKGPIIWSIFNPGVEFSPVDRVEISALLVTQARDHMAKSSTPGLKFQPCFS